MEESETPTTTTAFAVGFWRTEVIEPPLLDEHLFLSPCASKLPHTVLPTPQE